MNRSDIKRNLFMLRGPLAKKGYDWWWHNFTGYRRSDGEPKTFFIEYFVCNPALGKDTPILGQLSENKAAGRKPSYALIKAGFWGKDARQIHNFYGISDFRSNDEKLDIRIGNCGLTEKTMKGSCALSEEEAALHPEYMSGSGEMSWDLSIDKKIAYHVGYGASPFFRSINAFEMFWHAEGIKTEFSGEVTLNGETYDVFPERSFGYSDKNWGADFTSPWLWLASCDLRSLRTGKALGNSALEIGGGNPKVYGLSLGRKLLGGLYYEGTMFDFNFSKFWTGSKMDFSFTEHEATNEWTVLATNRRAKMEVSIECARDEMLFVNYESPDGMKRHNRLWNGGTGSGIIRLFRKKGKELEPVDEIAVGSAGCEYGEYDSPAEGL